MKMKPIHINDMRKALDIAAIRNQTVNLKCWKISTGDILTYDGWLVKSGHWRGGTHRLINPRNRQIREVRDVCIFEFMGHEIYM